MAKAAIEGLGRGATLGGSDLAAVAAGENPEDIKARMAANPNISAGSQMLGGAALIAGTGGLGEGALAAAAEGGAFGAGNLITDKALGDPDLNAQKIASEIGMGALLGLGIHSAAGGVKSVLGRYGYVSDSMPDVISDAAADNNASAEATNAIGSAALKKNTPEIIDAANEIGAPLTEGMVAKDPWIQQAEDTLMNGAPTYSGIAKAKLYQSGYDAAEKAVTDIVGEPEAEGGLSKAQLGQALENSLSAKIDAENQPISDLYNEVKTHTSTISDQSELTSQNPWQHQ